MVYLSWRLLHTHEEGRQIAKGHRDLIGLAKVATHILMVPVPGMECALIRTIVMFGDIGIFVS